MKRMKLTGVHVVYTKFNKAGQPVAAETSYVYSGGAVRIEKAFGEEDVAQARKRWRKSADRLARNAKK